MFRSLKNGFIPHGAISTHSKMSDEVRFEALKFAAEISSQIKENGSVKIEQQPDKSFTESQLAALAEIIAHELIYYHQLGEIGCYLASALLQEEEDNASIESDHEEEADGGFLCRTASCSEPDQIIGSSPKVGILSSTLLIASGKIRKSVNDLLRNLACPKEIYLLGSAGYMNVQDHSKQRHFHGLLVHPLFIRLGGGSFKSVEIKADISIDQIFTELAAIAKDAWTLMNLCGMLQIFRFYTPTPLFNSIKIDPLESIFGNDGWRHMMTEQAATMKFSPIDNDVSQQHWQCDDVQSSVPQHWECDGVQSSVPQHWQCDDVQSSVPQHRESDCVEISVPQHWKCDGAPSSGPQWAYPIDYYESFEEKTNPWDYSHSEEAS